MNGGFESATEEYSCRIIQNVTKNYPQNFQSSMKAI